MGIFHYNIWDFSKGFHIFVRGVYYQPKREEGSRLGLLHITNRREEGSRPSLNTNDIYFGLLHITNRKRVKGSGLVLTLMMSDVNSNSITVLMF